MAYQAPGTVASGSVWTAAQVNILTNDVIDHELYVSPFRSAWTGYTPTWTAATGTPSIGNGTLAGRYMQSGKTVLFNIFLAYGSTTSATGLVWQFTLPVANAAVYSQGITPFSAVIYDANTGNPYMCTAWQPTNQTTVRVTQNNNNASVGAGVPATWATNWYMQINGSYQSA